MSRSVRIASSFFVIVVGWGAAGWAQLQNGQATGVVVNSERQGIAPASLIFRCTGTNEIRRAATVRGGFYNAPELLPGDYEVTVSAEGFQSVTATLAVTAAGRTRFDFVLQSARNSTAGSGTQSEEQTIGRRDISNLPNLTRDPYRLAELTGNVSDAGLGTRGVGLAINGQRESSTNILLDGMDNKDEFTGSVGQPIPLDAMREMTTITSGFTAEYGRASGGIVSAAGRRGGNETHGSAYEFNRDSALTANSFQDNANAIREPAFKRNQFGGIAGGALIRNRLFYVANVEITLVRSNATVYAWVPSNGLLAAASPNTQSFFQALGQLRSDAHIIGTANLNQLASIFGRNPCLGLVCATLPATLNVFNHVAYTAPGDSGGGFPGTAWDTYNRLDFNKSEGTRLYGRYSGYHEGDPAGVLSNSPYANYDLGQRQFDNTALISAFHQWSPNWLSQTTVDYTRLTIQQQGLTSRGVVPTMYANPIAPLTIGADPVAFPGYNPYSPGVGGAFGGPENIAQLSHDVNWIRGRHLIRFGGDFIYIRDNRTDAAYQTAVDSLSNGGGLGAAIIGLLYGTFAQIQVAVNPQGQFPCGQTPACNVNLPVGSPNFSRSDRFNEGALYLQDYWSVTRRLAINAGVRWEHFGVQHNSNPSLDSNWYAPGTGFADANLANYILLGGLEQAAKSPIGRLYRPDWKDFAPRAGVVWDVFGDGRTSVRAGYGIGYDRNFGNVTFNVIQNLPNFAVLNVPGPITTSNFGPLSAASGTIALPPPGARIIDPYIKTAYADFWNAAVQREVFRGVVYSFEYSGSKGVHLYSVSYPNQEGFRNLYLNAFCTGNGDCRTSVNPYYGEDVGYRGNQGFSKYYGLNNRVSVADFLHRGITLTANYTWSHAIDNISSTFFEAGGQGVTNRYGDRNITINNGDFDTGLLDPYQPNLDRGNAEFDIRHRVVLSGVWNVPAWNRSKLSRLLTGGWSLDPLFVARSGQPFSVFDTIAQTLDLSAPRATFVASFPTSRNTFVRSTTPDTFQLFTFYPAQFAHEPNLLTPGSQWPANMSQRDEFRAPGFWNFDLAFYKDTKLTEKYTLQLRAEFFNVFNHANLYVIGTSANLGAGNTIDACFGCTGSTYDRRQVQLGARFRF